MIKHLTKRLKMLYLPLLILRDGGFFCWYCIKPLVINQHVFDHLNNNREDNRLQNIVLACDSCNNKKPHDLDMQDIAMMKLKINEESNFLRERKFLIDELTKEASPEIEINVSNTEITKQFITEKVKCNGFILKSEALYCSVYLCREKTGHGSPQSAREYIKILTCEVAPFKIVQDENKRKIIVRRTIDLPTVNPIKNDNFDDNLRGEQ